MTDNYDKSLMICLMTTWPLTWTSSSTWHAHTLNTIALQAIPPQSVSDFSPQGAVSRNAKCRKAYRDRDCLLCRKTLSDNLFTATTHSALGNKISARRGEPLPKFPQNKSTTPCYHHHQYENTEGGAPTKNFCISLRPQLRLSRGTTIMTSWKSTCLTSRSDPHLRHLR